MTGGFREISRSEVFVNPPTLRNDLSLKVPLVQIAPQSQRALNTKQLAVPQDEGKWWIISEKRRKCWRNKLALLLRQKQLSSLIYTSKCQLCHQHREAKSLSLNETTARLQRPWPESSVFTGWITNSCQRTDKTPETRECQATFLPFVLPGL